MAGQVAYDPDGKVVGENAMTAQAERIYANILAILEEAGTSAANIVKMNMYYTDRTQFRAVNDVTVRYLGEDWSHRIAATAVQVAGLIRSAFMLEIELIVLAP